MQLRLQDEAVSLPVGLCMHMHAVLRLLQALRRRCNRPGITWKCLSVQSGKVGLQGEEAVCVHLQPVHLGTL